MKRIILVLVAVLALSISAVSAQPIVTNSPPPVVSSSAAPVVSSTNPIVQQPVIQQQPVVTQPETAQQGAPVVNTAVGQVFASWQPFTGGVMMWWSDTGQIWVMTNSDGRVQVFNDVWREGMPNPNNAAPSGYFTPIRGFGAIWSLLGAGNSQLGWAMSEHVGYDTAARRTSGGEMEIQGPGNTLYGVSLANGASTGTWRVIRYG